MRGIILCFFPLRYKKRIIYKLLIIKDTIMETKKGKLFLNAIIWGFVLWLIGYILSFILFFIVPSSLIGWVIAPIGTAITLWVLLKKIKSEDIKHCLILAIVWSLIAVVFDYFFIIKALNPSDGYYKPAVYLYYALTLLLPIIVGWWKKRKFNAKANMQNFN